MLSCIQASHGVSQRTMGMRRLRRSLRHLGRRLASVQRSAGVAVNGTRPARTVVVVTVARIEPFLLVLVRMRRRGRGGGCGAHGARGGIMLGTHEGSRRRRVSGRAGRSWPAGGVDALRGCDMWVAPWRASGQPCGASAVAGVKPSLTWNQHGP